MKTEALQTKHFVCSILPALAVTTPNGTATTDDLLTALGHPLRRRILREMTTRERLSPRELAATLGEPLSNVSYHVRVLVDCEALRLVGTRPVRGSTQHFYRATVEPEWARSALGLDVTEASNGAVEGEETG
jgi:DNA-binding transcriptional ArsR family regulator